MEDKLPGQIEIFNLAISEQVKNLMLSLAKWARYLAIMGFIFMGVTALSISFTNLLHEQDVHVPAGYRVGYWFGYFLGASALLSAIYFYPNYALLRYSKRIREAISTSDQGQFESGIAYLRNSFRYMCILFLVCLVMLSVAIAINLADVYRLFRS